eukprot:m.67570 g.67570  ORF g.67570 m.67570 type:complete len:211 (-) comp16637_c1_seq1:85-717(-)
MSSGRTLEEVQLQADQTTDASLEATRRMLKTATETERVGASTLEQLDEQGEKLRRVEGNMDNINNNVKRAEGHLHQMEKCCGLCVCPWNRQSNFERTAEYQKAGFGKKPVTEQPGMEMSARGKGGKGAGAGAGASSGGYIQRVTNDAREDEMDENIGAVHSILGNLKQQAAAMSEELDTQNELIDRIGDKAEANSKRVNKAETRTQNLMK